MARRPLARCLTVARRPLARCLPVARHPLAPCLTAIVALSVLFTPVAAQPQVDTSRREALQEEIERHQQLLEEREREEREIAAALGETANRLEASIAERDRVSVELSELQARRRQLQSEIASLEANLADTEARIESILADLESLEVRVQALLVNLHRQRTGRFARVLSQAESFHELQLMNYYVGLLNEQDTEVIRRLDENRSQLLAAQRELTDTLAQREATERELALNESELGAARARLDEIVAELESTREGQLAQRQSLIESQTRLEDTLGRLDVQLQDEIRRLQEEEARLLREAQQAYLDESRRQRLRDQAADVGERIGNLTGPLATAPSGYVYPVAGHEIISRYGEENNSYMAVRAAVPYAAVVAVNDGVVRGVSFVSANDGYLVSIAHSERLSTVYTNLQPPLVEVGQRVSQGDLIGYLGGSTLVAPDTLKLWVQVNENGRSSFVDPAVALGL